MLAFKRFYIEPTAAPNTVSLGIAFENGEAEWHDAVFLAAGAPGWQVSLMLRRLAAFIENAEKAKKE